MNHWPFIIGAYGAATVGLGSLVIQSFLAMRRAERQAEQMKAQRR